MYSPRGYSPLRRADRPTRKGAPVYRVESLRKEAFGFLGPIRIWHVQCAAGTAWTPPMLLGADARLAGERVGQSPNLSDVSACVQDRRNR